jgi:mannitol/fructose-specific phosphotransferase system IIA component (Ntr-type)
MKLSQLVTMECLVPNLKSNNKNDVLKELLSHCDLSVEEVAETAVADAILEREAEQTTGVGEGMAFPHARIAGLTKIHIVIGFSKDGIEFDALDKKVVHCFVLILVTRNKPNELLKTRAAIAKLLNNPKNLTALLAADTTEELHNIITTSNIEVDYEITAKDIMRPLITHISPTLTIRDAARALHLHHVDSLPVIDKQKKFHGEISCYDLFSYGLPDFFNNLHVISFVKHMNPFEKYFNVDKTLTVADLLERKSKSELVVAADATLMEIIFEMTVKNKEFLYVLSADGKLKGILDRYSIVDKILVAR